MKRLALMTLTLLLIDEGKLAAQTPVPQTPAQTPAPTPAPTPPVTAPGNTLPLAVAPPGTPVVRSRIPVRTGDVSGYEEWTVEFTVGYWPFQPIGRVKTQSTPGDLRNDLGIAGYKSHPYFRLAFKPKPKHAFLIEGVRYRLNGATTLNRELQFPGRTFTIRDNVESRIKLNSFNLNYLYNFVSNKTAFAALVTGIGYLEANAKIRNVTRNVEEGSKAKAAFPMVGAAARLYPAHSYRFSVDGELKGMHFGNYGYYLQSNMGVGLSIKRGATIHLGYAILDADVHNKYETEGLRATFKGPTVAIQLRH